MIPQWYTLGQLINRDGIEYILSKLPLNKNIEFFYTDEVISDLNATIAKENIIYNKGASRANDTASDFGSLIWSV